MKWKICPVNLFANSLFEGQLYVDAYPQTAQGGQFSGIAFNRDKRAVLAYKQVTGTQPSGVYDYTGWLLGQLYYGDGLDNAVIVIPPREDGGSWKCIAVRAETRQEALAAMEKSGAGDYIPAE